MIKASTFAPLVSDRTLFLLARTDVEGPAASGALSQRIQSLQVWLSFRQQLYRGFLQDQRLHRPRARPLSQFYVRLLQLLRLSRTRLWLGHLVMRTIGRHASLWISAISRRLRTAPNLPQFRWPRQKSSGMQMYLCMPLTLLRCQPCMRTRTILLVDTQAGSRTIHEAQVSEAPDPHSSWSFERDGHRIQPNGRPFMLEIFGGSARLTLHLREIGADSFAVDWKDGKLKAGTAAILMLNLNTSADQAALIRLSSRPSLVYVHLAPPCGTSSRAREVPLRHCRGPAPLRSEAHPAGLPGLFARDLHRVDTAKVDICIQKNVAWSVDNPRNSLMWWFSDSAYPGYLGTFPTLLLRRSVTEMDGMGTLTTRHVQEVVCDMPQ